MLKAKFTPPTLPAVIERPRLIKKLISHEHRHSLWLSGPPGSGKTTLALQFLCNRPVPFFWCRLGSEDQTLAGFFDSLGSLAKAYFPTLTDLPHFYPTRQDAVDRFAVSFFERLYAALPKAFTLVLDDYHVIPMQSPIHDVLAVAIEHLPRDAKVFIISRNNPSGALVKLLVNQHMGLLHGKEILFNDRELSAFLAFHGVEKPADVDKIIAKAEGWVAGALLLLHDHQDLGDRAASTSGREYELLFEYFLKEEFAHYSDEVKVFHLSTSLLSRFTAHNAAELTAQPLEKVEGFLDTLYKTLHFIERRDDASGACWYQYHPLFKQFLEDRCKYDLEEQPLAVLRKKSALLAEQAKDIPIAAQLLIAVKDWESLAHICEQHSQSLILSGQGQALLAWVNAIPLALREKNPWLLLVHARVLAATKPVAAGELYAQAYALFDASGEAAGQYLAWAGIATGYLFHRGKLDSIDAHLEKFIALRVKFPTYPSVTIQCSVIACLLWCLNWRLPSNFHYPSLASECEQLLATETDMGLRVQLISALIWHHCIYGQTSLTQNIEAIASDDIDQHRVEPHVAVLFYSVQTLYFSMQGRIDTARDSLDRLEKITARWGMDLDLSAAIASLFMNLFDENVEAVQRDLLLLHNSPNVTPLIKNIAHISEAWLYCITQDYEKAVSVLSVSTKVAEELGYAFGESICHFLAVVAHYKVGDLAAAEAALQRLRQLHFMDSSTNGRFKVLLAEAWLAIQASSAEAPAILRALLQLGRDHQIVNFYGKLNTALSDVYSYALHLEIADDYVLSLISRQNVLPNELGRTLPNWPWPVRIRTLGAFSIWVGETELDLTRQSARPIQLLKLLVSRARDPIAVPELIELLWPELDGEKGINNYKVTLSRLRKLISKEAVLQLDNRLSLNRHQCWVDAWVVQGMVSRSWHAQGESLQRLHGLYAGPFLPNDGDYWLIKYRDHVHQEYLTLLVALAEQYIASGDLTYATAEVQRGLAIDDTCEPLYLAQIKIYALNKQKTALIGLYTQYKKIMMSRFGSSPSTELQRHYELALQQA